MVQQDDGRKNLGYAEAHVRQKHFRAFLVHRYLGLVDVGTLGDL